MISVIAMLLSFSSRLGWKQYVDALNDCFLEVQRITSLSSTRGTTQPIVEQQVGFLKL